MVTDEGPAYFLFMPRKRRITLIPEERFDKKKFSYAETGSLACYIRGARAPARFGLPAL